MKPINAAPGRRMEQTTREQLSESVPPELRGRRCLFLLASLDLGGAERQAILLASALARAGVHVQVWGFGSPGSPGSAGAAAELCDAAGLPWRAIAPPWAGPAVGLPVRLVGLVNELRKARPDLLMPYTRGPNILCGLLWPWTGARASIWNQRDEGIDRSRSWAERHAVRRTPWFVANSQAGADHLVRRLGAPAPRVHVIRNGVALAPSRSTREQWRRRLGIPAEAVAACMIANLGPNKDHVTLLQAWKLLAQRIPGPPRLALAGRLGDTAAGLRRLADDLSVEDLVSFLGPVDDVSGLLAACDLSVFSSPSEGSPNGVLEAMAAGLALAASDIPGIRDAVSPENYAHLAPPGDPEAFADRIQRLIEDPAERLRVGRANRKRIDEVFSPRRLLAESGHLMLAALRGR